MLIFCPMKLKCMHTMCTVIKLLLDHSSVDVFSNEMHAHHVYTKLLLCVDIFSNECMHTICTCTKLLLDQSCVDMWSNEMHAHHVYTNVLLHHSCVDNEKYIRQRICVGHLIVFQS